jgi:hypothetical protein
MLSEFWGLFSPGIKRPGLKAKYIPLFGARLTVVIGISLKTDEAQVSLYLTVTCFGVEPALGPRTKSY